MPRFSDKQRRHLIDELEMIMKERERGEIERVQRLDGSGRRPAVKYATRDCVTGPAPRPPLPGTGTYDPPPQYGTVSNDGARSETGKQRHSQRKR